MQKSPDFKPRTIFAATCGRQQQVNPPLLLTSPGILFVLHATRLVNRRLGYTRVKTHRAHPLMDWLTSRLAYPIIRVRCHNVQILKKIQKKIQNTHTHNESTSTPSPPKKKRMSTANEHRSQIDKEAEGWGALGSGSGRHGALGNAGSTNDVHHAATRVAAGRGQIYRIGQQTPTT